MEPLAPKYVPVGTVRIQLDLNGNTSSYPGRDAWTPVEQSTPRELRLRSSKPTVSSLPSEVHDALLDCPTMVPFKRLLMERWIRMEFRMDSMSDNQGAVRVFLLPDDVYRHVIDRTDPKLISARKKLIGCLDYSDRAWLGQADSSIPITALLPDPTGGQENADSLLHLFNGVPSPDPSPDTIADPLVRDASLCLLNGIVQGVATELYPYQRRSAALMLQRESAPTRSLDPRLIPVVDRSGGVWYYDHVTGTPLRQPRYYDGVSGGILAEEMGSGKTLICLSLILATRFLPLVPPDPYKSSARPIRKRVGSLLDMAASCATRNGLPWMLFFEAYRIQMGYDFTNCLAALGRHVAAYQVLVAEPRRTGRNNRLASSATSETVFMSKASLVIVPDNLLPQWQQEIQKHTTDLVVITITKNVKTYLSPSLEAVLGCDVILGSQDYFARVGELSWMKKVHFRRCIIDEGHQLGNTKTITMCQLLRFLDGIRFSHRWIATGTPSRGLFGVESRMTTTGTDTNMDPGKGTATVPVTGTQNRFRQEGSDAADKEERDDLERIRTIAALYLKARPWANTTADMGDTVADWSLYVMQPKHGPRSRGRIECLRETLNSLMVRHRLADIDSVLPPVDDRTVVLDGSYQDRLSLNLFYMMIVFNSVQSQRTDIDYFFHPRQRASLAELVKNLKQASFFGGAFFTAHDITQAVATAEAFLAAGKVPISPEDKTMLREAIAIGHVAMGNPLRTASNQFQDVPLYVRDFPVHAGHSWLLADESETGGGRETDGQVDGQGDKQDGAESRKGGEGQAVCTSSALLLALQKSVQPLLAKPTMLNTFMNGDIISYGQTARAKLLASLEPNRTGNGRGAKAGSQPQSQAQTALAQALAGNAKPGSQESRRKAAKSNNLMVLGPMRSEMVDGIGCGQMPEALRSIRMVATSSAKLSYLLDAMFKHKDDEQMIIFYEASNVGWHIASVLEVLGIAHLIYAKGLSSERKAQYVDSFNNNAGFRVLLMDLAEAAVGLDMRAASRVYFVGPVLNPQVAAQAVGRVRRVSQQKPVTVETLVLRDSIDEVIVARRQAMSRAEQVRCRQSLLLDRPIAAWIRNRRVLPLSLPLPAGIGQTTLLVAQPPVFASGVGRVNDPDHGLVSVPVRSENANGAANGATNGNGLGNRLGKRLHAGGGERARKRVTVAVTDTNTSSDSDAMAVE